MGKRKSFDYQPAPRRQVQAVQEIRVIGRSQEQTVSSALLGIVFLIVGTVIALLGVGVIPISPANVHCPMFILTAIGLLFACAGLSAICPSLGISPNSIVMKLLGMVIVSSFLTPFGWVAFGDSGLDIVTRCIVGAFVSLFGLLFGFATIVAFVPGLAKRLGVETVDNNDRSGIQIGSRKQN